jgi:hypothetical protein
MLEEPPPDPGAFPGELLLVKDETPQNDGSSLVTFAALHGRIGSGLNIGAELEDAVPLQSNERLTSMGVMLAGSGFILDAGQGQILARKFPVAVGKVLREYRGGRDLTDQPRRAWVIDFAGLDESEARAEYPQLFEIVVTQVRPERLVNRDIQFRTKWWLFGRTRPEFRALILDQSRYIATTEVAKHRFFQFLESTILLDHSSIAFGLSDAFHLGVLSSRIHVVYALAAGGTLEDRPRYNKSRCFDPFPFPDCTEKQKQKIRALAEELDAHRKRAQATHKLGLTDIYNVLEKLRAASRPVGPELAQAVSPPPAEPSPSGSTKVEPYTLTPKERAIHDAALVSTLKQLHDDLDAAVADAYGWPWPLTDADILERVVALNAARAAEEARGHIRWLRPDYQIPLLAAPKQSALALDENEEKKTSGKSAKAPGSNPLAPRPSPLAGRKAPWPKPLADRVRVVESALAAEEKPATAAELAKRFTRAKPEDLAEILDTLVTLGRARPSDTPGTYIR